jgi:undecaprenyl-diphosphatase
MILRTHWKLCCLGTGLLATAALFVLASAFPKFPGDERALLEFQAFQTGWLDNAAVAVSSLGMFYVFVPIVLVLVAILALKDRRADAFLVGLSLVPIALNVGLKALIDRPRPDFHIIGPHASGLSFPSGHSVFAFIVGGVIIYLVEQFVAPLALRRWIQGSVAILVVAIGASRVYMGAHWPSDVIGGYLFGALALLAMIAARNAVATSR